MNLKSVLCFHYTYIYILAVCPTINVVLQCGKGSRQEYNLRIWIEMINEKKKHFNESNI